MVTFHVLIAGDYMEVRRGDELVGHIFRFEDYCTYEDNRGFTVALKKGWGLTPLGGDPVATGNLAGIKQFAIDTWGAK